MGYQFQSLAIKMHNLCVYCVLPNFRILVITFSNNSYQIRQYQVSISAIHAIDFGITNEGTFSKIWTRLRAKSKILKTWMVLEMSVYKIEHKTECPCKKTSEYDREKIQMFISRIQEKTATF